MDNKRNGLLLRAGMAAQRRWNVDPEGTEIYFAREYKKSVTLPVYVGDSQPPSYYKSPKWIDMGFPHLYSEQIELHRFCDDENQLVYLGYGPRAKTLVVYIPEMGQE